MVSLRSFICLCVLVLAGCASTRAHPAASAGDLQLPVEIRGKAAVFLFVGMDCPISNGFAPELNRIIHQYSGAGIDFYLVYPDANVTMEQANAHATQYGYHCGVLIDPQHRFAKALEITVTPEAAVVSSGKDLLYRGRIDDTYAAFGQRRFAATTHELRDALDAVLQHRAVAVARTVAVGCRID